MRKRLLVMLWLTGCSAVAPIPDAGRPGVDAGASLDAGGVTDSGIDAGVDAGPVEPTLGSSVLYLEDFESYPDLGALKSNYPVIREVGGSIVLEDAGTNSMRVDYAPDGGCADAEVFVGKLIAGDLPEIIVSWRFRLEAGFLYVQPASHCSAMGSGSTEFVVTRPGDPSGRISLEASDGGWRVAVETLVFAQQWRLDSHGPLALSQAAWHRVTLLLGRESGVGAADGVVRVWIDGAIVLERGGSTGTAPFTSIRYPTLLRAPSRAQSRWIDDVVVFVR